MVLANNVTDVSLLDGSTEVGFMLARDKYGYPIYTEEAADVFNVLQGIEGLDENALDPKKSFAVAFQDSWVGGFGQEFYERGSPRRYLSAFGCDLSEPGVAKIGPLWRAVAYPTVTTWDTFANLDLETWSDATTAGSWTEAIYGGGASGDATRSTTIHGGTYAAKLDSVTDLAGRGVRFTQSCTWGADMQGKKFRMTAWCRTTNGTNTRTRIGIYDGVSYTYTNVVSDGVYAQFSVTATLDATATELTLLADALGTGALVTELFLDDVTIVGYKKGTNTCFAEFKGNDTAIREYMACGDILFSRAYGSIGDTTAWTYETNVYDNISCLLAGDVSGTQYLFICTTTNTDLSTHVQYNYWNGSTLAAGPATGDAEYLAVNGTTFYQATKPNIVNTNTAPLAGAWSSNYRVGSTDTNITALLVANGTTYVIKEDGIYTIASDGTATPKAPDLKQYYGSNHGLGACVYNGDLFIPMGTALIWYDTSEGTWDNISPAKVVASTGTADTVSAMMLRSQTDFDDVIVSVAPGDYLWLVQKQSSTKINLYKGQYAVVDGQAAWRWHPVGDTTLTATNGIVSALAYSVLSGGARVWVGNQNTAGSGGYYDLTAYQTGAGPYFVTPWYTGNLKHIQKAIHDLVLGLQTISNANYYVTVSYQKYGESSWTSYGTYDTTVTTGEQTIYAPANFNSVAVRFKVAMQTNDSTKSPQVNYLRASGKVKPVEIPVIRCRVICTDNGLCRNGTHDCTTADSKRTSLDNIAALNWPTSFYNIAGSTYNVDLLSRRLANVIVRLNGNMESEHDLVLQKIILS